MPLEPTAAAKAETGTAPAAPPSIVGYIDTVRDLKVSGWAWNCVDPSVVLEIEIRRDGTTIARGRADRFRADLEKAGIGDGRHAFQVMLEMPVAAGEGHGIEVLASCPGLATPVRLVNRAVAEPAGGQGGALPMSADVRQWLDQVAEVQRSFETTLRSVIDDIRVADVRSANQPALELRALTAAVDSLHGAVGEIARQMQGLEVFQARFDGIVAALENADARPVKAARADQRLVAAVTAVAAMSLLSLVLGIWAVL